MFTIESKPNPLSKLVESTASGFVQNKLAKQAEQERMQKFERATQGLDENSSDISWFKALNNVPREDRADFLKIHENIAKGKKEGATRQAAADKEAKVAEEEQERADRIADEYGIPRSRTKGLKPADIAALGRHENKGGASNKPVDPAIVAKIRQIKEQNPGVNADQLQLLLDESGVPPSNSHSYVETQRRQDDQERVRENISEKVEAKADSEYKGELAKKQEAVRHHQQVTDRVEELINKGASGKLYEKGLEKFGLENLTSEERRELAGLQKEYTRDLRQILGSQMSSQEFFTILNTYPSPNFSKEANQAIINNYRIWDNIKQEEINIANQLLKENNGRPPRNFALEVQNRLTDYAKTRVPEMRKIIEIGKKQLQSKAPPGTVLMYNPEGKILYAPKEKVDEFRSLGAVLP